MKKVVIGIGSPLKRDDNVGNLIIDELKENLSQDILLIRGETNPENYIDKLRSFEPEIIYFIDAVEFDGKTGEVRVFDIEDVLNQSLSTHGISVKIFKKFFPDSRIKIIGIKTKEIIYGEGLSEELKQKLDDITKKIEKIIRNNLSDSK
jgi:hydrogenase maturation protease